VRVTRIENGPNCIERPPASDLSTKSTPVMSLAPTLFSITISRLSNVDNRSRALQALDLAAG